MQQLPDDLQISWKCIMEQQDMYWWWWGPRSPESHHADTFFFFCFLITTHDFCVWHKPMANIAFFFGWLSMIIWGWVWIYHEHMHLVILFNLFTLHLLFLPVLWNTRLQWDPNCEQHNCCIELQNSNPQKLPVSNMRTIVLWCMLLPSVHHVFTKHQAKPSTQTHFSHGTLNWWIFSASCRWPPKMINPLCGHIVSHIVADIL